MSYSACRPHTHYIISTTSVTSPLQSRTGIVWGTIAIVLVFLMLCGKRSRRILPWQRMRTKQRCYSTSSTLSRWPPGRELPEHCTGGRRRGHYRQWRSSCQSRQVSLLCRHSLVFISNSYSSLVTVTFDLLYESCSTVPSFRLPFSAAVYSFAWCIVSFIRHDCAVERGPIRLCALTAVDGNDLAFEFFNDLGLRSLLRKASQSFSLS